MCSTGDLKAQPKETACWDGVHDSEAQNFLGAMKPSSIATVKNQAFQDLTRPVREASPDHTQFEKNSPRYDPSSKKTIPMVRGGCPVCSDGSSSWQLTSKPFAKLTELLEAS